MVPTAVLSWTHWATLDGQAGLAQASSSPGPFCPRLLSSTGHSGLEAAGSGSGRQEDRRGHSGQSTDCGGPDGIGMAGVCPGWGQCRASVPEKQRLVGCCHEAHVPWLSPGYSASLWTSWPGHCLVGGAVLCVPGCRTSSLASAPRCDNHSVCTRQWSLEVTLAFLPLSRGDSVPSGAEAAWTSEWGLGPPPRPLPGQAAPE
jgi:hypothetical protein